MREGRREEEGDRGSWKLKKTGHILLLVSVASDSLQAVCKAARNSLDCCQGYWWKCKSSPTVPYSSANEQKAGENQWAVVSDLDSMSLNKVRSRAWVSSKSASAQCSMKGLCSEDTVWLALHRTKGSLLQSQAFVLAWRKTCQSH